MKERPVISQMQLQTYLFANVRKVLFNVDRYGMAVSSWILEKPTRIGIVEDANRSENNPKGRQLPHSIHVSDRILFGSTCQHQKRR